MKQDFSAGGIVFNNKGQVLLVGNYKPEKDVNYWGFPKGHPEGKESLKEAALREVEEETGVKAEITRKVDDLKYFFYWEGEKTFKTVTFYLMKYLSGEVKYEESELSGAGWFSPDEVLEKITFKTEKELFNKAMELSRAFLLIKDGQ